MHVVVARFEVASAEAATKLLKVGYSDVARIYVNGTLLFEGDNRQYSHDPGFLGIVGAMLSGISMANYHILRGSTARR